MSPFVHVKVLEVANAHVAVENSTEKYAWVNESASEIVAVYLLGEVGHQTTK